MDASRLSLAPSVAALQLLRRADEALVEARAACAACGWDGDIVVQGLEEASETIRFVIREVS